MPQAQHAPFGNPDGSRADLEEILQGFVNFGGSAAWGGLGTRQDDLTARVIVGRKGSGKTVYLRRLQAYTSNEESLYADGIQQDLPATDLIVKFCQWFPEPILTEKWMEVWHRAILRSVVAHVLHHEKLKHRIDEEVAEKLQTQFKPILREFRSPVSIYSQVKELIESHSSSHQVMDMIRNPLWSELEWLLADGINRLPPLCFYMDAVDEEFGHAPMFWLRCQKGLFYTTMRLLRDSRLGGRLHVVICVRDSVLSSVLRSEHSTRYLKEPHIRVLNWNREAITYFLNRKIAKLPDEYFVLDPSKEGKTLKTWLGVTSIRNEGRKIDEQILPYLLRHTRLLPRDIVTLGNFLCEAIAQARIKELPLSPEVLRTTVSKAACAFGNEQLAICGNQILSDMMPAKAGVYGYSEAYTYTGNQEYMNSMADNVKKLINWIGKDRFNSGKLDEARQYASALWEQADPFSILWQNGLLGFVDRVAGTEKVVFFSEDSLENFNLPIKKQYAFHSCLIDAVGIQPVGNTPV